MIRRGGAAAGNTEATGRRALPASCERTTRAGPGWGLQTSPVLQEAALPPAALGCLPGFAVVLSDRGTSPTSPPGNQMLTLAVQFALPFAECDLGTKRPHPQGLDPKGGCCSAALGVPTPTHSGGNPGGVSICAPKSSAQPSSIDTAAAQDLEGELVSFMKNAIFYL